jgi:hypothetical protein
VERAGDDAAVESGGKASAVLSSCLVTWSGPRGDGAMATGWPIVAVSVVVVVIAQTASPGGAACGNGAKRAREPRGRVGQMGQGGATGRACSAPDSPDCPSARTGEAGAAARAGTAHAGSRRARGQRDDKSRIECETVRNRPGQNAQVPTAAPARETSRSQSPTDAQTASAAGLVSSVCVLEVTLSNSRPGCDCNNTARVGCAVEL